MVVPRIIVSLILRNRYFFTSYKYKEYKYLGDPINIIKILNEKLVDELIVISPDSYREGIDYEYLSKLNKYASMPIGYVGGIRTEKDAQRILKLGYEKIGVNTLLFDNHNEVQKMVESFGSSSVTGILDLKKNIFGKYKRFNHINSKSINFNLEELQNITKKTGIGELIINNVSRNGTWIGLDIELHKSLDKHFEIPVIHGGGIGSIKEFFSNDTSDLNFVASSVFSFQKKGFGVMINYPSEMIYNRRLEFAKRSHEFLKELRKDV